MDRDSMTRLKLDRRLIQRRGWISEDDLRRELEGLPDVSHKVATPEPGSPRPGGPDGDPAARGPGAAPEPGSGDPR